MPYNSRIVIVAFGNAILSDDGVGVAALEHLRRSRELPGGVTLVDAGIAGPGVLGAAAGCDGLLVLDAVDAGGEPGEVFRFDLREGVGPDGPWTVHELGLQTLLQDLRFLDVFPARAVLIGVQPRSVAPGTTLSPPVARAVETMVGAALAEVKGWVEEWTPRGATADAGVTA